MRIPQDHVSRFVVSDGQMAAISRPVQMCAVAFKFDFLEQVAVPLPDVDHLVIASSSLGPRADAGTDVFEKKRKKEKSSQQS